MNAAGLWYRTEGATSGATRLLLFLHGYRQNGGEHKPQVTKHGPWRRPKTVAVHARLNDFFRVGPHLEAAGAFWDVDQLREFVREVRRSHPQVSKDRMVLVGISRGGKGVLEAAARHGRELGVAAVAACCPEHVHCLAAAADVAPVHVFHGRGDAIVPLDRARQHAYEQLSAHPNFRWVPVHDSWTLGDKHHNCWTSVFNEPELFQWLRRCFDDSAYRGRPERWPDFARLMKAQPAVTA